MATGNFTTPLVDANNNQNTNNYGECDAVNIVDINKMSDESTRASNIAAAEVKQTMCFASKARGTCGNRMFPLRGTSSLITLFDSKDEEKIILTMLLQSLKTRLIPRCFSVSHGGWTEMFLSANSCGINATKFPIKFVYNETYYSFPARNNWTNEDIFYTKKYAATSPTSKQLCASKQFLPKANSYFPVLNRSKDHKPPLRFPQNSSDIQSITSLMDFVPNYIIETKMYTKMLIDGYNDSSSKNIAATTYAYFPVLNGSKDHQAPLRFPQKSFDVVRINSTMEIGPNHGIEIKMYTKISIDGNNDNSSKNIAATTMTQSTDSDTKYGQTDNDQDIQVQRAQVQPKIPTEARDTHSSNEQQQQIVNNDDDAITAAATSPAIIAKNIRKPAENVCENESVPRADRDFALSGPNIKIVAEETDIAACLTTTTITPTTCHTLEQRHPGAPLDHHQNLAEREYHSSNTLKIISAASSEDVDEHDLILDHQPFTHAHRSDVRDSSSQTVLVNNTPVTRSTVSVLTVSPAEYANLLPNYYALEQVESNDRDCAEVDELTNEIVEMTIANAEDSGEAETENVTLLDNHQQLGEEEAGADELSDIDETFDEMKFDMKSAKGASNALPLSMGGRAQLKNDQRVSRGSASASYLPRSVLNNEANLNVSSVPRRGSHLKSEPSMSVSSVASRGSHLKNEPIAGRLPGSSRGVYSRNEQSGNLTSAPRGSYLKNEYDVASTVGIPRRTSAGSYAGSGGVNAVEAASNSDVSRSASMDVIEAVLPTRTMLRRQRRMLSQSSQDEPEDPIERLNRLRARISGALTEVKGVLRHYSTDAEEEGKKETSIERREGETKSEAAPVAFRFVRKVRRRSVFIEEEEDKETTNQESTEVNLENKAEQKDGLEKERKQNDLVMRPDEARNEVLVNATTMRTDQAEDVPTVPQREDRQFEQAKEMPEFQPKDKHTAAGAEVVMNGKASSAPSDEMNSKEPELLTEMDREVELAKEDPPKQEVVKLLKETEVKENESVKKSTTETCAKTKKKVVVKSKDTTRRASIAAVEDTTYKIPTQRRPSDSEAVIKKKVMITKAELNKTEIACEVAKNEKTQVPEEATQVLSTVKEEKSSSEQSDESANESKSKVMRAEALPTLKVADEAAKLLPTVKEEKSSSEHSDESANEPKHKLTKILSHTGEEKQEKSLPEVAAKPKRRLSNKAKDEARRASIAAVEGSKIEPPVVDSLPLQIKMQRRPSDSEAVIKRKACAAKAASGLNGERTVPKVKIITKVRRPSLKGTLKANESLKVNEKTSTAISNDATINETINSSKDAAPQIPMATTKATVTATSATAAPETAAITKLPTQLAIDDASSTAVSDAAKAAAAAVALKNEATKDFSAATKSDEQSVAMVATLVSPLRAGEPSSQVNANAKELAELVGETVVVAPTTKSIQCTLAVEKSSEAANTHPESGQKIPEIASKLTAASLGDSKEPINNQLEITAVNKQAQVQQTAQQVPATATDTGATVAVVEKSLSAAANETGATPQIPIDAPAISVDAPVHDNSTKANASPLLVNSSEATVHVDTAMPELQVKPAPVQLNEVRGPKDELAKKKIIFKKIIRKNSIDKAGASKKIENDNSKPVVAESKPAPSDTDTIQVEAVEEAALKVEEIPAPPKKPRTVKKKVIIKCQKRRLSVSDTFFKEPVEPDKKPPDTETLEKPIEYVTDEEADEEIEPVKPLKTCMRLREYEVGDWVMYGERFRKTQIRWKKGRIVERITSISYKIDIDGTEVSAHISYIKKFTDRKVNFGGKEYLEIDYEQIAEEEKKARSYSIWNMV